MKRSAKQRPALSELEHEVMQVVWRLGQAKADDVRRALEPKRSLKESTVRTVLGRLEAKGALSHSTEGRTFIYIPSIEPDSLGIAAVHSVADRFFSGSIKKLLLGMADHEQITPEELRNLADMIDQAEKGSTTNKTKQ